MIVAHILGLPVEESIQQLAPLGVAIVSALAIARQTGLGGLQRRRRRRSGRADR